MDAPNKAKVRTHEFIKMQGYLKRYEDKLEMFYLSLFHNESYISSLIYSFKHFHVWNSWSTHFHEAKKEGKAGQQGTGADRQGGRGEEPAKRQETRKKKV